MKKIFLFLVALLISTMTWAETTVDIIDAAGIKATVTLNDANNPYQMGETPITLTGIKGSSNFPALNYNESKGTDLRFYKGTTCGVTFEAGGATITKIEFLKNASTASTLGDAFSVNEGTLTENVWEGEATSVTLTYDADGTYKEQMYIINVTYVGSTPQKEVVDVKVTEEPTKMEYFVGESFDPAGMTVTAIYSDASFEDVTNKATWTIQPETFTEASEAASVSVKAEFKTVTSKPRTITGIVVTAKVVPTGYASVYTSNVELTAGENSNDAVIKYDDGEYNGVKCGTSSKTGSCTTTIPAATKMLHFHAIGWKGATSTTLTVNGTEYTITPDDGITGNSPFTLVGDAYEYYYTFDPQGATEITFTSDKRFVVFGVNAELQEGAVVAPTFTPTESEFDGSVEVTLSCETDGVNIFYTLDGSSPIIDDNPNIKYYSKPFKLTETTTIKAAAINQEGKNSDVAEKTYTKIPVFNSLNDLLTNLPATDTQVKVKVTLTDIPVDAFYVTDEGYKNGVYTHVGDATVELYEYNVPETWEVGGTLSGTIIGQWGLYKGMPELQKWEGGWNALTYKAGAKGLSKQILDAVAGKSAGDTETVDVTEDTELNVPTEAGLVNLIINGNGHKVTVKADAQITTQAGLTINNLNFDCAEGTVAPIAMSANPDSSLVGSRFQTEGTTLRSNAFYDVNAIVLNGCNFSDLKTPLVSANKREWNLKGLTIKNVVAQFNTASGIDSYIHWYGNSNNEGSIKDIVIEGSTLYNIVESNSNYFLRLQNSGNSQPQKAWAEPQFDAKESWTMTNNTFVNLPSNQNFANNYPSHKNVTFEWKNNIFYNVYGLQKASSNAVKNFTAADNAICGITKPVDGTDKSTYATEDTLLCKGDAPFIVPTEALDFTKIDALINNFTPSTASYAGSHGFGDPRWAPNPTGINDLKSNILQNGMQSGKVYNLRGQRVERMVKGQVYILDGKKFMAK